MTSSDHRIDARDWWLLGVLSVLWGGSFFFAAVSLQELPPLTIVFLRVALAAIILLPVLWIYRIRVPTGLAGWQPFFALALLNNVLPFSLIVIGQTYIPSGLASVLNATTPLFTVLVMAAAGDEKLYARRVAGVVVGLIGVIILHGQSLDFEAGQSVGILLCLTAAFSYGLSALYARRKLLNSPPLATAAFQLMASSLVMAVVAAAVERPWQRPAAGRSDMARHIRQRGIIDRARLHHILPDFAARRLDQRHAGYASYSRDGNSARSSGAGRGDFAPRDRWRGCNRQRFADHRRASVSVRSKPGRNSITSG